MDRPVVGSVVAIQFPFSDASTTKLRPALVLGHSEFGDIIVCQITSKPYTSKTAIEILPADTSHILRKSYIRPDKIFTADMGLVVKQVTVLADQKRKEVRTTLHSILSI